MALVYLIRRFFYRIIEFLRHWYIKSLKIYSNFVLERLERIDRVLAWRINFNHLFKPLYGDYSWVGRILSFLLRIIRLLATSVIYLFLFAIAVAVYMIWLLIPVAIILSVLA